MIFGTQWVCFLKCFHDTSKQHETEKFTSKSMNAKQLSYIMEGGGLDGGVNGMFGGRG